MTRKASSHFDDFDPEVIEAARDVANRAGVPLEAWIASVVPKASVPGHRADGKGLSLEPQVLESGAGDTDHAEQSRAKGLTTLVDRIDDLDRSMEAERRAEQRRLEEIEARIARALQSNPDQQVTERLGDIERRVAQLGDQVAHSRPPGKRGKAAVAEMREAVQEIRQRQRELAGETNPAEGTIATMQRDIARRFGGEGTPPRRPIGLPAYVAEELQREATRLREALAQFPTTDDIAMLDKAVATLATGIDEAGTDVDLTSIAQPIGVIRARLEHLSSQVPGPLHSEVAGDIQHFSGRLEVAAAFEDCTVEGTALHALFNELEGIRATVALLAEPERIEGLVASVQALSGTMTRIEPSAEEVSHQVLEEIRTGEQGFDAGALAGEMYALAGKVEELKAVAEAEAKARAEAAAAAAAEEAAKAAAAAEAKAAADALAAAQAKNAAEALAAREAKAAADAFAAREAKAAADALAAQEAQAAADALAARDALAAEAMAHTQAKVEPEAPANVAEGAASTDMASIYAMLHSLAEKVDRVGERAGSEGLDALERHVLTLADRIETPRSLDPALTSLERTMTDLMRQVETLRTFAPHDEMIEIATRTAVSETLQAVSLNTACSSDFGLLRASLADMQARQIASDERLSSTLEGVQSALDRLVNRLGTAEQMGTPRAPSLDERLLASTSVEVPLSARRSAAPEAEAPAATPAAVPSLPPAPMLSSLADGLLQPGAPRPGRSAKAGEPAELTAPKKPEAKAATADSDIKTSFIAAARRAAQAAQAELAAEAPLDRQPKARPASTTVPTMGTMARMKAGADQHRRPILLGLAAVVLTLGAIGLRSGEDATLVPQLTQAPDPAPVAEAPPEAPKQAEAPKPAEAPKVAGSSEPSTTQALPPGQTKPAEAPPAPAKMAEAPAPAAAPAQAQAPAAGRASLPQVAGMATLAGDLATVPPNFDKLKQAALTGEGLAVWELALREADGRGMPRDATLAAKLFEKLASAGYAPAQYKLGAHYEKGTGVSRDLAQAKLWYGRAAEQGHARAMHNLGVIFAENPGAGGKPDLVTAATWFRKAAEHGIRDSQYNVAVLYARGLGLQQDLVQSYAWFSAAAAQGDDDAGKKRDDVGTKLSAPDLARAKSLASSFKPRKGEPAVNEPPLVPDGGPGPMSLLGAPMPNATAFAQPGRKAI